MFLRRNLANHDGLRRPGLLLGDFAAVAATNQRPTTFLAMDVGGTDVESLVTPLQRTGRIVLLCHGYLRLDSRV